MWKRVFPILGAGVLLLMVAGSSPQPSTRFTSLFCPECRVYLWGGGTVDMKGNCAPCGKYPVEIEAQRMAWFWCFRQENWLTAPCARNATRRCCARQESLAAVVPAGREVSQAWYCPAHLTFEVVPLPLLSQPICGICARPAVNVPAALRTWYWCEEEGVWAPAACPMNPVKNCCEKREALLLVKPEMGPIAGK